MKLFEIHPGKARELRHELRDEDREIQRQRKIQDMENPRHRRGVRAHYIPQYLNVPFREKEEAKKMGARWDPERKKWYVMVPSNVRWEPKGYEHWWQK